MGSFCNYANSSFAFLNLAFFLAWSTYSQREELYMSEDTKNLARASSMTNGAWTRGEFVTCFRPPHVNWIRAKFGKMMQSSLCSNSSRCSKIILQIDPKKCQWALETERIPMMPLTVVSFCFKVLCESCRVPLKVVVKLSFWSNFDIWLYEK